MKAPGREPQRKSCKPISRVVLDCLLSTCGGSRGFKLRDGAILLVAFAASSHRRSEEATLRHSRISVVDPIKLRLADQVFPTVPCMRVALGRTRTTMAGQGASVFAARWMAVSPREWMRVAKITSRSNFREVRKDSSIGTNPLTLQSVNLIL
jgi:hypothetical protein